MDLFLRLPLDCILRILAKPYNYKKKKKNIRLKQEINFLLKLS
jgi:hypothetical protein